MAANITPLQHHADRFTGPAGPADAHDPEQRDAAREDARETAAEDRQNMRGLAPSPSRTAMIGTGVAAILVGGAVGYWLGGRRPASTGTRVRDAVSATEALAELAPVALHLMSNPAIRSLALRMVMRQLTSRLAA